MVHLYVTLSFGPVWGNMNWGKILLRLWCKHDEIWEIGFHSQLLYFKFLMIFLFLIFRYLIMQSEQIFCKIVSAGVLAYFSCFSFSSRIQRHLLGKQKWNSKFPGIHLVPCFDLWPTSESSYENCKHYIPSSSFFACTFPFFLVFETYTHTPLVSKSYGNFY